MSDSSMFALYSDMLLNRGINGKLTPQLYENHTILTSPSSTSHIYVAIYDHHLHMMCMSHNLFDTLDHVLHMINFTVATSMFLHGFQQSRLKAAFRKFHG